MNISGICSSQTESCQISKKISWWIRTLIKSWALREKVIHAQVTILLTLNCNEVYKDSYVIWATIISLSLSKSSTDETISLIILSVDCPRNGWEDHISYLCALSYWNTAFFFFNPSYYSKYPHPIKHQFCFHSAVFTAVKMLIVNLFICPKALPEPEFFFSESTCPGDTAKPAFDQCLILLDAQGCVV